MTKQPNQAEVRAAIEAVVREALAEVLKELLAEKSHAGDGAHDGAAKSSMSGLQAIGTRAGTGTTEANRNTEGTLNLSERLVTTATLAGQLRGMTACLAPAGAVVTPAARDLLRERGVKLAFAAKTEEPSRKNGKKHRLILANTTKTFDTGPLAAALACPRRTLETTTNTDLLATLDGIVDAVKLDVNDAVKLDAGATAAAIVLTSDAAAAVCLANRAPGVRAAQAASVVEVSAAIRALGPNVLIVDPTGRSYWELVTIAKTFANAGPLRCSERWSERLR